MTFSAAVRWSALLKLGIRCRSMRDIRVATIQFQHAAGDKGYNFGRLRHFVTEA